MHVEPKQPNRHVFAALRHERADTVQGRAVDGELSKDIIQHLAIQEPALVEVAQTVGNAPELRSVKPPLNADSSTRRDLLKRLEKMSRGVQGINLNMGQDFDGVLQQLIDAVAPEIERDLTELEPAVRSRLPKPGQDDPLNSAEIRRTACSDQPEPAGIPLVGTGADHLSAVDDVRPVA